MAHTKDEIEGLKGELAELGARLERMAGAAAEDAQDYKEGLMSALREKWHRGTDAARRMGHATKDYVEENPWQTAAMAGAIGLLIGFILGKKRD